MQLECPSSSVTPAGTRPVLHAPRTSQPLVLLSVGSPGRTGRRFSRGPSCAAVQVPRLQLFQQPFLDDTHPGQVSQDSVELAAYLPGVERLLGHTPKIGTACKFLRARAEPADASGFDQTTL